MKSHDIKKDYFKSLLIQCLQQLLIYKHRYKSRKALLKLDDRMLQDIGINREQANQEGHRYFWKGDSFVFDTKDYTKFKVNFIPGKHPKSRGMSF